MIPIQTEVVNQFIRNQIDLERYSESVRGKVTSILEKAQAEIVKALVDNDPTVKPATEWKKARLADLNKQIEGILQTKYGEIDKAVKKDLSGLASYQNDATQAMIKRTFGANLFNVTLTQENLAAIVGNTMIDGAVIGKWWSEKPEIYRQKIEKAMNMGMQEIELGLVKGEAVGDLIRRIRGGKNTPGVMDVAKHEAAALVRTSVMQVAQTVRRDLYDANADVIKGLQVVATLDARTTPLCRALDGTQYDMEGQPLNGGRPLPPGPPFHWNCRSTIIPIFKAYSELQKGEGKVSGKKLDEIEAMTPGTRASMNGQVPDVLNYNDWLKTQPIPVQKDILGESRWDLWQGDKLTMADMIHQNGRPLTLPELEQKVALYDPGKALELKIKELMAKLEDPNQVAEFKPGDKLPESVFSPIKSKNDLVYSYKEIELDPIKTVKGKKASAGVIMYEPETGKVWIYEPKNHFKGYENTFPKGTLGSEAVEKAAIREVWEETGLEAQIVGYLGDYEKTESVSRYYIGIRTGGSPATMGWEAQGVRLVPQDQLENYLNVNIDKKIAQDFKAMYQEAVKIGNGEATAGFEIMGSDAGYSKKIADLILENETLAEKALPTLKDVPNLTAMPKKQLFELYETAMNAQAAADINSWLLDKGLKDILPGGEKTTSIVAWKKYKPIVEQYYSLAVDSMITAPVGSSMWRAVKLIEADAETFKRMSVPERYSKAKQLADVLVKQADAELFQISEGEFGIQKHLLQWAESPEGDDWVDSYQKMTFIRKQAKEIGDEITQLLKDENPGWSKMNIHKQAQLRKVMTDDYVEHLSQLEQGETLMPGQWHELQGGVFEDMLTDVMSPEVEDEFIKENPFWKDMSAKEKLTYAEENAAGVQADLDEFNSLSQAPGGAGMQAIESLLKENDTWWNQPLGTKLQELKAQIKTNAGSQTWLEQMEKMPYGSIQHETLHSIFADGYVDAPTVMSKWNEYLVKETKFWKDKGAALQKEAKNHGWMKNQPGYDTLASMGDVEKAQWLQENIDEVKEFTMKYGTALNVPSFEAAFKIAQGEMSTTAWDALPIKTKYQKVSDMAAGMKAAHATITAATDAGLGVQEAVSLSAGNSTVIKLGSMSYDLADPNQLKVFKQKQNSAIQSYKAAIVQNKKISQTMWDAVDALSPEKKALLDKQIAEKGGKIPLAPAAAPSEAEILAEKAAQEAQYELESLKGANPHKFFDYMDQVGLDEFTNLSAPEKVTGFKSYLQGVQAAEQAATEAAAVATETPLVGKVTLGPTTFDLSDPAQLKQFKQKQNSAIQYYKQVVLSGKKPSALQQQAVDLLSADKKELLKLQIEKKGGQMAAPKAVAQEVKTTESDHISFLDYKKYANKKGSNTGGFYQNINNPADRYYVKTPPNEEMARNEMLAGKLYAKAGVEVPELKLTLVDGQVSIASRLIDGVAENAEALKAGAIRAGVYDNFVVDAWLGDWDVVGATFDNLMVKDGVRGVRIDLGGSLRFRAQGVAKGEAFGHKVEELSTMRNANLNPQAESVFKHITKEELTAGARKVLSVSDEDIRALVERYGPKDAAERRALADTLIARKQSIAEQFPELKVKPQAPAPPPPDTKAPISDFEHKQIKASRANGYSINIDKEDIEDHNVLFWQERAGGNKQHTLASFKVREDALRRLDKMVGGAAESSGEYFSTNSLHDSAVAAIKGIKKQYTGVAEGILREQDIMRAKDAWAKYKAADAEITNLVKTGRLAQADLTRFRNHYKDWMELMQQLSIQKPGTKYTPFKKWMDVQLKPLPMMAHKVKAVAAKGPDIKFRQIKDAITEKKIEKGHLIQTNAKLSISKSDAHIAYEADVDGVRVRYWGKAKLFADQGKIEFMVDGEGAEATQKVLRAMEKLGINTTRSAVDEEILYLKQMLYHMNDPGYATIEVAIKNATPEAAVKNLRDLVSKKIGKDVTKLKGYAPLGERNAFGQGKIVRMRPDLAEDKAFQEFRKEHVLYHSCYSSIAEAVDGILESGGNLISTTNKLRVGMEWGGQSPGPDMGSGGAHYLFTRLQTLSNAKGSPGLQWDANILRRMDSISYDRDLYGRVTGNTVQTNRKTGVAEWKAAARSGGNETIFKDTLSILDPDFKGITCNSETERREVIGVFKKHGYKAWPDGRSLEKMITAR